MASYDMELYPEDIIDCFAEQEIDSLLLLIRKAYPNKVESLWARTPSQQHALTMEHLDRTLFTEAQAREAIDVIKGNISY